METMHHCAAATRQLAPQSDADDSDDQAEECGEREQEDGLGTELSDGESVVRFETAYRVGRCEAEEEHRQSPGDATDEKT
jgi:hypothetical protein